MKQINRPKQKIRNYKGNKETKLLGTFETEMYSPWLKVPVNYDFWLIVKISHASGNIKFTKY